MKKCLLFFLLFFVKVAFSQVTESFDDGNFTNAPQWSGNNLGADFAITGNQLRSNSTAANTNFYLSTANALATNCVWEFFVNLQFATSGTNYVDVYLTSDQQNLQAASINAYFVRIGNTNDEIALYKRTGANGTSVKLIDGADGSVSSTSNNRMKIKVTRTAAHTFTLERDITGNGTAYIAEGTTTDASFTTSAWFGFLVQQSTATFFQKHFFDDISINAIVTDLTPPKLLSTAVISDKSIEIIFDESVNELTAKNVANYSLNNGLGNPVSAEATNDAARYVLTYPGSFTSGTYTLTVTGITDKSNNIIAGNNTAAFSYIQPYLAKSGDVVINEIFADPSPQVDLPGAEYIELWNTTTEIISLKDWKFKDPSTTAVFPAYVIKPSEHLVLCAKADTLEFKKYGAVLGIAPWPSLNNSGDAIELVNAKGTVIAAVTYKDSWYKSTEKKAGGWSLELMDNKAICTGYQNWTASADISGGTPGKQNSVYQLHTISEPLALAEALLIDSVTVFLSFNRLVDSVSAMHASYNLNNGLGRPISVNVIAPEFKQVELKFANAISRGKTYKVTVANIADCSGILLSNTQNTVSFLYPDKINKNDILISELLFNPRAEGADFIEIYNHSDKELNLHEMYLAGVKGADSLISIKPVSTTQLMLKPAHYLVLSTNPDNVKQQYYTENPDAFLKVQSLPSLNDDEGTIVLLAGKERIDQFTYSAKMHFGLIKDAEGVSLERVSFTRAANEAGNFRSAAASVGYATPGYKNSQFAENINTADEIALNSKTFSPDNDGFEDALAINYNFKEAGLVANASVYNDKGVLIKRLLKNITLSAEGTIFWDGLDETSNKASVGIYIFYLDVFDLKGNVKKFKKTCVLAAKL